MIHSEEEAQLIQKRKQPCMLLQTCYYIIII